VERLLALLDAITPVQTLPVEMNKFRLRSSEMPPRPTVTERLLFDPLGQPQCRIVMQSLDPLVTRTPITTGSNLHPRASRPAARLRTE
jgi:hypothetical protein